MQLGKVIGCVWSTQKDARLGGQRLLLIQPLNTALQPAGKPFVATDCTGAGASETIYWCRGKESSFPFLPVEVPTDATVVGIVDTVHLSAG